MLRITLGLFTALTLVSGTAQASPYAGAAATARLGTAGHSTFNLETPGYATPGEAPPAQPAPQPYEAQPVPAPQPYGDPALQPTPQPYPQPVAYGPPPGPAPYQPPPPPPRRRGKGMMIAGFITFGASYLTTAFVGAVALDGSREFGGTTDSRAHKLGTALVIPVIGPLIAIPQIDSYSGSLVAVLSFIAQAGGLSLGIAGAVRYSRDGQRIQAQQAGLHLGKGVRLGAAPRLGGGTLNLNYRF